MTRLALRGGAGWPRRLGIAALLVVLCIMLTQLAVCVLERDLI